MAIMTNIPIMDIMTIVTITSNMTNCAYYTPSRDTKTPLTKKGFRAKGAKVTTLREAWTKSLTLVHISFVPKFW